MATVFLADNSFGDNLGDGVAGPVGLLIIVLLAVATALLIRNMNKRLRRLPESFPDPRDIPNPRDTQADSEPAE
jgi:hypothetical protein